MSGYLEQAAKSKELNPDPGRLSWDDFVLRLCQNESSRLERDTGDHVLNPGMPPYARWDGKPREAAVLIPVIFDKDDPTVLLTLRTEHLSSHAGQISFPGGKVDACDETVWHTALREAHEEIGLAPGSVRKIGALAPYLTGSGYRISPVVGEVSSASAVCANPEEVADVFEVPLSFLMNPRNHQKNSLQWKGQTRYFYEMPYGDRYIWGVTAGIIRSLYETVFT